MSRSIKTNNIHVKKRRTSAVDTQIVGFLTRMLKCNENGNATFMWIVSYGGALKMCNKQSLSQIYSKVIGLAFSHKVLKRSESILCN